MDQNRAKTFSAHATARLEDVELVTEEQNGALAKARSGERERGMSDQHDGFVGQSHSYNGLEKESSFCSLTALQDAVSQS